MIIPEVVPAILTAEEEDYEKKLRQVENLAARVQIDIMDGVFVDNVTIGAATVEKFGTVVSRDIHLMVNDPIAHVGEFSRIGVDRLIFHAEVCENIEVVIEEIKSLGNRVGVALNLETPVSVIDRIVASVDLVQLMAIEPGFSGQRFNPQVLPKILSLREKYPNLSIAVDGGVSLDNAQLLVGSGATELVVTSHLFEAPDIKEYISQMEEVMSTAERRLETGS